MNSSGQQWAVSGVITRGDQVGRTLGFPTANLDLSTTNLDHSQIQQGVHLVKASLIPSQSDHDLFGLAYYGPRHVFGEEHLVFEVFLYKFEGDIYGHTLKVEALNFLRPPQKVTSLDELKELLESDKKAGQRFLEDSSL